MNFDKIDFAIIKILYNQDKKPIGYQALDRKLLREIGDYSYLPIVFKKLERLIESGSISQIDFQGYIISDKGKGEYLNLIE
jgi:hypothetical protein